MGNAHAQALGQTPHAAFALDQIHMGNDHQIGQLIHRDGVQEVIHFIAAVQGNGSFQRGTDGLIGTGLLQNLL